jgi:hypothetical protein
MRHTGRILACLCGLACAASSLSAQETVLGSKGELYAAKAGTYGSLFPGGKLTDPANAVLALEIVRPGQLPERILIPGTEGDDVERLPFLVFEEVSETVFLVWERRLGFIHPLLMLSGFNGDWLEPVEVVGNPFANKTSPYLLVTQDTYGAREGGQEVSKRRTILNLVWGEENGAGLNETFYTPVIFENGVLIGRSPVFKLNDYDPETAGSSPDLTAGIAKSLRVQQGRDQRTFLVAFVSPASQRLNTVEIDILPPQLAQLADGARSHIIDIGSRYYPARLQSLAEKARSHIIDIGRAFQPEVASSIAQQVYELILSQPSGSLGSLADKARSHIIDIGAKLSGRGLRTSGTVAEVKNVGPAPAGDGPAEAAEDPHLLQFRALAGRLAPPSEPGEVHIFLSESGEEATVAWVQKDRVVYRDSSPTGWQEPREIRFAENLDARRALAVIEQRTRSR